MATEEILNQFPSYDENHPETWVGSKEYWKSVFKYESNRDPELHKAFGELHTTIVNMIIQFCKEHNLKNIDEFRVSADGIMGSIEFGEWCPCTDSSMSMIEVKKDEAGYIFPNRETPFLYEI